MAVSFKGTVEFHDRLPVSNPLSADRGKIQIGLQNGIHSRLAAVYPITEFDEIVHGPDHNLISVAFIPGAFPFCRLFFGILIHGF